MSQWRIFVHSKPKFTDHRGKSLEREWRHASLGAVKKVRTGQAYELSGALSREDAERLAQRLLADPVTQEAAVFPAEQVKAPVGARLAEIWPKGGVSDPVADTVAMAARDMGFAKVEKVRSGAIYEFWGVSSAKAVQRFCEDHLMNNLVQQAEIR